MFSFLFSYGKEMVNFLALSLLLCDNEPLPNIKRTLNIENMSIDIITSYFVGHRISQIIKQIINGSKWEKNVFENDKIDLQLRIIFRFVLKVLLYSKTCHKEVQ